MTNVRIERLVTNGTLVREAQEFYIENNVWLIGNDEEVLIIDAAHDATAIERAVAGRETRGILLTHGHEDHVNAALQTAQLLDTHTYLHPADLFLWEEVHQSAPDFELSADAKFTIAEFEITTLHTPGHTPGSVCFSVPGLNTVFSGDTLFQGGPGATRWEYSSFPQIIESIQTRLFELPAETTAHPGHGASTTVDAERVNFGAYIARGW